MAKKVYISKCMRKDIIFSRLSGPLDKTTPGQIVEFRNYLTKPIFDVDLQAEIEEHPDFGDKFWLSEGPKEESKIVKATGPVYSDGPSTTGSERGVLNKPTHIARPVKTKKK